MVPLLNVNLKVGANKGAILYYQGHIYDKKNLISIVL